MNFFSPEVGFNTDTVKREYFKNRYVFLVGDNKRGCDMWGRVDGKSLYFHFHQEPKNALKKIEP